MEKEAEEAAPPSVAGAALGGQTPPSAGDAAAAPAAPDFEHKAPRSGVGGEARRTDAAAEDGPPKADDEDLHLKDEWERWQAALREKRRHQGQEGATPASGQNAPETSPAAGQRAEPAGPRPAALAAETAPRPADTAGAQAGDAARAGRGAAVRVRGAAVAAAVGESVRPRVEKLRDASVYVLEEPPDDSGLSFVVLAVGLFVLFLVFLFLSTVFR